MIVKIPVTRVESPRSRSDLPPLSIKQQFALPLRTCVAVAEAVERGFQAARTRGANPDRKPWAGVHHHGGTPR